MSAPTVAVAPGTILGNYRLEAPLGEGGMAVVYRVRHTLLGSLHALKLLTVGAAHIRSRLLREGQVQASLRHPNIVAVTDIVVIDGGIGLVMEYVDGPPLDLWLEQHRPSFSEAMTLFYGIALGVAAAHAAGVVHRDLKPANILIANSVSGPVPKVADFGIVKVLGGEGETQAGITMGTAQYMPPEQIKDARRADQRSDVWSLGCILYELLTGRICFDGNNTVDIFNKILSVEWTPPSALGIEVPRRVEETLRAIFQLDPSARPQSCTELLERLYDAPPVTTSLPPSRMPELPALVAQMAQKTATIPAPPPRAPNRAAATVPLPPAAPRPRAPAEMPEWMAVAAGALLFTLFVVGTGAVVALLMVVGPTRL